ncbi:MAG: YeeE/YedE family protein [Proteobacteria bacterium]|nr:MAG: YeeE/YedE family protein [Pseudomonadota bacterium]
MTNFTPLPALIGGVLIGLAAVLLLYLNGRVAGVSGIMAGVMRMGGAERWWRFAFVAGLVLGGGLYLALGGNPVITIEAASAYIIPAGLLVGFGTRLGNGCTSGHGVCGVARLSARSLIATAAFMATAIITVFIVRHMIGG